MYRTPCTTLADFEELTSNACPRFESMMPADNLHRRSPRKWWECNFLADCVERCIGSDGTAKALGLGVGIEPLIFYFARGCKEVLATDLYSSKSAWPEARVDDLSELYSLAPFDYDRQRVRLQNADMRNVPVADGSYDFVWSCSSIEHVPTLEDMLTTFREIHRILTPGGYAFLTAEFCLSQPPYLLKCLNCLDKDLFPRLIGGLRGLELVGPVHLDYNWNCKANHAMDRHYLPLGFQYPDPPLQALDGPQMANYGGISQITPIGYVLRKTTDGQPLPQWEELDLPEDVRDYGRMLDALAAKDFRAAIAIGQPYVEGKRGGGMSLQFRLHWWRFFLEAVARGALPTRSRLAHWLDQMAALLPDGDLQDADCFDLHTRLCGVLRNYDLALAILPKIIRSPSTTAGHALKLTCRMLRYASFLGRFPLALETLQAAWADLAAHRSVTDAAIKDFQKAFVQSDLSRRERRLAVCALRDALRPHPNAKDLSDRLQAGMRPTLKTFLGRLLRYVSPSAADNRKNVVNRILGIID
jgi:SAM-dependent methyltransferase